MKGAMKEGVACTKDMGFLYCTLLGFEGSVRENNPWSCYDEPNQQQKRELLQSGRVRLCVSLAEEKRKETSVGR